MRTFILIIALVTTPFVKADPLKNAAWLQGCWTGLGMGGQVEECWMQDKQGLLTGVFQLTNKGIQRFSEIMSIGRYNGHIEMRVKHFDPNFNQWASDKNRHVSFILTHSQPHQLTFDGISYQLINPNTLKITVSMTDRAGKSFTDEFYLARRKF